MNALVTRRSVMLGGAVLAAATTTGGLVWLAPPAQGMRALSPHEVEMVESIARVLFPPGYFPVYGGDGGTAPMVDEILSEMVDPNAAAGFRYMLRAIEIGTLISRGIRFSRLSAEEQFEVVDIWFSQEPAPRRMAGDSVKVVIGKGLLRRAEVIDRIGWRRGCIDRGPV